MCIIVDANAAGDISRKTADGLPVLKWLLSGRGGLVVGGLLTQELVAGGMQETLIVLERAGRLHRMDNAKVQFETSTLQKLGKVCKSNDHHVLAVAIVSKCRLIFSRDKALHADAKNLKVLKPSASIYQGNAHAHLLTDCHCGKK